MINPTAPLQNDRDALKAVGPTRRCIASGRSQPVFGLIRFVVAPDGMLTPDLEERLPGRGLWVSANRAAFLKACDKKLFPKAAKTKVTIGEDFPERLEQLLVKRCQNCLGLARKSGLITLGFEKTKTVITNGIPLALIEAADASADQAAKVRRFGSGLPVLKALDRSELSEALGRDNVVHGALLTGPAADGVVRDMKRLDGFRTNT